MKNKLIILLVVIIVVLFFYSNIFAETNPIISKTGEQLRLDTLISDMEGYIEDSNMSDSINVSELTTNIIKGDGIGDSKIFKKILEIISSEVMLGIKTAIAVLIIIVLTGIFNSLELEKGGQIGKIVYLVSFMTIVTMLSNVYIESVKSFTSVITILTSITQTVTPFMMVVLIASGGAITSSMIEPLILFVASLVGFVINYVCIPFITISVVMKIISSLGENIKLERLGALFSKTSVWVCTVVFTLFLSYITLKGNVTTSVDTVAIKTTQTAISNFVPVVGKFVSDSLESIMGATEVIGKAAGIVGIIIMIIVTITPVIKILVVMITHKVLAALAETITDNKKMIGIIDAFGDTYKIMLGVLVGVVALFVMSTGVVIKLMGQIN